LIPGMSCRTSVFYSKHSGWFSPEKEASETLFRA
jgi:hypothetical protein